MAPERFRPDLLGNFADVHVGTFENGTQYARKVLGEKTGGYTLVDARNAVLLMRRFEHIASSIGLPTAETFDYSIKPSSRHSDRFVVTHTQEYLGSDLEQTIKNDPGPVGPIRSYLNSVRTVADHGFQICLDIHTANFCVDHEGVARYIDFMPPKQTLDDGTKIAAFPIPQVPLDPFFVERIFTLEGQLPDVYSKLLRALTYNKSFSRENTPYLVKSMLGEFFGDSIVERMINEAYKFREKSSVSLADANSVRILASERVFDGTLDVNTLERIYSLTHFTPNGEPPTLESVQEAVGIINTNKL